MKNSFFILNFSFLSIHILKFPPFSKSIRKMRIDIGSDALAIQSAGCFVTETIPLTYDDADQHPLCLFLDANADMRKNIVLYSPEEVEGLIALNNRRIVTLNVPQLGFDKEADPSRLSPLLVTAVGIICQTATPGTITARDAFSDCFFLGEEDHPAKDIFARGDEELPPNCFRDHDNKLDGAISRPADGSLFVYRFPKCIPRSLGLSIEEGPLKSAAVQESLETYHQVAQAWIKIQLDISNSSSRLVSMDSIRRLHDKALPLNPGRSTILKSRETTIYPLLDVGSQPGSLKSALMQRISLVTAINKRVFFQIHPELKIDDVPSLGHVNPTQRKLSSKVDADDDEDELLHKKHARSIASWRLLLAIKNAKGEIVLPQLTERFLQCFEESKQQNARTFKSSIGDWMKDRQGDNRDYFLRKIEKVPLNYATCKFFLDCSFHVTSLDEDKTDLEHSISILSFLPVDSGSDDYSTFCSKMKDEELDDDLEEAEEKKNEKTDKNLYQREARPVSAHYDGSCKF